MAAQPSIPSPGHRGRRLLQVLGQLQGHPLRTPNPTQDRQWYVFSMIPPSGKKTKQTKHQYNLTTKITLFIYKGQGGCWEREGKACLDCLGPFPTYSRMPLLTSVSQPGVLHNLDHTAETMWCGFLGTPVEQSPIPYQRHLPLTSPQTELS